MMQKYEKKRQEDSRALLALAWKNRRFAWNFGFISPETEAGN
jgi:hypothetical protein